MFHWFKKKNNSNHHKNLEIQNHDWSDWAIMTSMSNVRLLSKYVGELRFGPAYLHLKTEPINLFGKEFYGDWLYKTSKGVYLQRWNSNPLKSGVHTKANNDLVFLNTLTNEIEIIERNIDSFHWTIEKDDKENLTLISDNGNTVERIQINQ